MKIKTSELIGPALDYMVHVANGNSMASCSYWLEKYEDEQRRALCEDYSTDWACGGPLIEREGLRWNKHGDQFYVWTPDHPWYDPLHEPMWYEKEGVIWRGFAYGPTLLVAAMRCYVASKLGDEVDIPEELT